MEPLIADITPVAIWRGALILAAAVLAGVNLSRAINSPLPHQRLIMASWLALLLVVIGDQVDRWADPPSWRTGAITIALAVGWLGVRAWKHQDELHGRRPPRSA